MSFPRVNSGSRSTTRTGHSRAGRSLLLQLVSQHKARMLYLALISFFGAFLEAGFLVLVTGIASSLVAEKGIIGPFRGLTLAVEPALVLAAVLLVVRLITSLTTVNVSATLGKRVAAEQRRNLTRVYLEAGWPVQQSEPTGHLQVLTTSFVHAAYAGISALNSILVATLSIVAFMTVGVLVDPISTLLAIVVIIGLGAILIPIRQGMRRRSAVTARHSLAFAKAVSELGSLGMEMHTFGVRDKFDTHIEDLSELELQARRRATILSGSLGPSYTTLAYSAVLMGVALLTRSDGVDIASVGATVLLMLRSLSQGQTLQGAFGSLAESEPYLERIVQSIERYASQPAIGGVMKPATLMPLVLSDVSFSYKPGVPAISGLSANLSHGEIIGIIGPSGAGKSTVAQLLLGLREPHTGEITAGGVPIDRIDRIWWSSRVAFVPQDAILTTGTVAENIRFFRDGWDYAELERAARQASVLSDIESLPLGFDTHLGERGSQLSGGQRQRLSIARALLGEPELLILDEPTSALDGQSEALIRSTMLDLKGRISIVIIAHRMSTLDLCDRIMVIEDGRVSAFDNPSLVFKQSAFYRNALAMAGGN